MLPALSAGKSVLDIACGTGRLAAAASERGARATGVDFAPAMVEVAAREFPKTEFRQADAENLPFEEDAFDAAICGFAVLHFADPDRAIAEAYRVLRPAGRYAFTVWATPDTHEFFDIVLTAIEAAGDLNVPLPPSPPHFRFSNHTETRKTLEATGFHDVDIQDVPLVWRTPTAQGFLDQIYNGAVRAAAILELQEPEARANIHRAILERAEAYRTGDGIEVAMPAVLAVAKKP